MSRGRAGLSLLQLRRRDVDPVGEGDGGGDRADISGACLSPTRSSISPACARTRWRRVPARRARRISGGRSSAAAASRPGSTPCPRSSARRTCAARSTAIADAKRRDGGIIWGLGAHVIKTGVSPVLIDLMQRGFVSALALNGAGIIHDFEIALSGATSEDVDESLGPGRFGMAEETGVQLNEAIRAGAERGRGWARRWRDYLSGCKPSARRSKSCRWRRIDWGFPMTVHVAARHRYHPHASRGVGRGDRRERAFAISGSSPRASPGCAAAST